MEKFIVIYHAPADAIAQSAASTPEEQAKGMEPWMQWAEKCGDKLIDLGAPLVNGQQLNPDGSTLKSDKNVSGYSILQASNIDEAKELLQGHPHLAWNADCTIEIHEAMPLPGVQNS